VSSSHSVSHVAAPSAAAYHGVRKHKGPGRVCVPAP
jgi:hypothetical protein